MSSATAVALAGLGLLFALGPAVLFLRNLSLFRRPPPPAGALPPVSVLVPARDEERSIAAAVTAVLTSRGVDLEVVVLDDGSTDSTAQVVRGLAAADPRVRLVTAPPLPAGWCGKQHACHVLAGLARHAVLVFVDADVRLEPEALARAVGWLERSGAGLVSGFPRQETGSLLERLVLPLVHFLLLGFLPFERMRRSRDPAYGAGCGQLMVAHREAYAAAGGHRAIRASLHDGLTLPRAFRRAGFATDIFDASADASCRMYRGAGELWRGLVKNSVEGLGAPTVLPGAAAVLLAGQVLPCVLLEAPSPGSSLPRPSPRRRSP